MRSVIVSRRFCGPPDSANGGYTCGLIASQSQRPLTVRLLKPPPLETPMTLHESAEGDIELRHGEEVIAQARPGEVALDVPPPPTQQEAIEASRRYSGFMHNLFPTCFVCGRDRAPGDGLRIFAGSVADREIVAAPWTPDASLDAGDGKIRPEFMWAALDCPGYAAANPHRGVMLLGEMTAQVDRRVRIGEPCIVIGWRIATSGRKHEVGTAVFDSQGTLCGRARALWIEPRQG